jgi:hypothetical protein
MITAKLAKKPYLEISRSAYDQLVKTGKKKLKITILHGSDNDKKTKNGQASRKRSLAFADRTLGMWADDMRIERAFKELEGRWQQWRDEMLS